MDQLIYASLSHTHYWYEVGMYTGSRRGLVGNRVYFDSCESHKLYSALVRSGKRENESK